MVCTLDLGLTLVGGQTFGLQTYYSQRFFFQFERCVLHTKSQARYDIIVFKGCQALLMVKNDI